MTRWELWVCAGALAACDATAPPRVADAPTAPAAPLATPAVSPTAPLATPAVSPTAPLATPAVSPAAPLATPAVSPTAGASAPAASVVAPARREELPPELAGYRPDAAVEPFGAAQPKVIDGVAYLPFDARMTRPTRVAGDTPALTAEARAAGVEGTMLVRCLIKADGSVASCDVLKGLSLMNDVVLRAVRTWRMSPALLDGKPVAVGYMIPFRFLRSPAAP